MSRSVENWLEMLLAGRDDSQIASFLLRDLTGYRDGNTHQDDDRANVLALLTAVRLQQETANG